MMWVLLYQCFHNNVQTIRFFIRSCLRLVHCDRHDISIGRRIRTGTHRAFGGVSQKQRMSRSPSPVRWFESSDSEPPKADSTPNRTGQQLKEEVKEERGWYDLSSSESEKAAYATRQMNAAARVQIGKAVRNLRMDDAVPSMSGTDAEIGPQPGNNKKRKRRRRRAAGPFFSLDAVMSNNQYLMRDQRLRLFRSPLHGWGIVALEKIDADTQLCPYVGSVIPTAKVNYEKVYTYGISFSGGVIDAFKTSQNPDTLQASFFNTCHPALPPPYNKANVNFEEVSVRNRKGCIVPRIIARAAEDLQPETECLADYHWLLTASDPTRFSCSCTQCFEFTPQ